MKTDLSYLTEKILNAKIETNPFNHIYIEDFFSTEHFNEIINSDQIKLRDVNDDVDLLNALEEVGYNVIGFPGCIEDKDEYLNWHKDKKTSHIASSSNEGFGMVFRLKNIKSQLLSDINKYILGEEFNKAVAERFNVEYSACNIDSGIQKYLDSAELTLVNLLHLIQQDVSLKGYITNELKNGNDKFECLVGSAQIAICFYKFSKIKKI